MKRFKLLHLSALLLILAFVFTGCASTGFLMGKAKVTMFGNAYPPKDTEAIIDVYRSNTPTQEYVEFAQIVCGDTNDNWSLQQIFKKAREIGADAVIITGRAGTYGMGIPMGNLTYVTNESYGMTAIAIKYKQ